MKLSFAENFTRTITNKTKNTRIDIFSFIKRATRSSQRNICCSLIKHNKLSSLEHIVFYPLQGRLSLRDMKAFGTDRRRDIEIHRYCYYPYSSLSMDRYNRVTSSIYQVTMKGYHSRMVLTYLGTSSSAPSASFSRCKSRRQKL